MTPTLRPPPPLARARRRRGANAIEFALCMPVWLLMMSAIYDLSWLVLQRTTLDSALNMGCRSGAFVDPGAWDQDADAVLLAAEEATWSQYEKNGRGPCIDCTFTATLQGSYPNRTLRCQLDKDYRPFIGAAFAQVDLQAVQVAQLRWQH